MQRLSSQFEFSLSIKIPIFIGVLIIICFILLRIVNILSTVSSFLWIWKFSSSIRAMFLRILAMWIRRRRNVTYLSFRCKLPSYFMVIKSCRGFSKPTVYILRTRSIIISSLCSHTFSLRLLNFRLFWRTVRTPISSFWNSSSRILSSCILLRRLSTSMSRHDWTVFLCCCFLQSTWGLVYFSIHNIV